MLAAKTNKRLARFWKWLLVVGTVYLNSFTVSYLASLVVKPAYQSAFIEILYTGGQLVGLAGLGVLVGRSKLYESLADFDFELPGTKIRLE